MAVRKADLAAMDKQGGRDLMGRLLGNSDSVSGLGGRAGRYSLASGQLVKRLTSRPANDRA